MIKDDLLRLINNAFGNKNKLQHEDILAFLQQARANEVLEQNTYNMLEGVLEVQQTRVKDVMVPKSQMISIDSQTSLANILPIVVKSGHSRFPVIGSNKDEVVGILLAKDLLNYAFTLEQGDFSLATLLRPADFVPESRRLDLLLQDFRHSRSHMAVVVDEYGQVAGVITIEDVLEQIVGDIEDEHDPNSSPVIKASDDGAYFVKASTSIEEFETFFNTELEDYDSETIGGLIMRKLGYIPQVDEELALPNFKIKILRADARRLHLLSVTPASLDAD